MNKYICRICWFFVKDVDSGILKRTVPSLTETVVLRDILVVWIPHLVCTCPVCSSLDLLANCVRWGCACTQNALSLPT